MSSTRRTAAPRKRPASSGTAAAVPMGQAAAASADEDQGESVVTSTLDPHEMAAELMSQIEGLLRDEPSIDEKGREEFSELFARSLREVADSGDYAQIPNIAECQETLVTLSQEVAALEGGADGLARMLNSTLQALEQTQTKLAFEFSRRMQVDGQESAVAWLKEQQQAEAKQSSDNAVEDIQDKPKVLRTEVTQSRSRRLRGPPKK